MYVVKHCYQCEYPGGCTCIVELYIDTQVQSFLSGLTQHDGTTITFAAQYCQI